MCAHGGPSGDFEADADTVDDGLPVFGCRKIIVHDLRFRCRIGGAERNFAATLRLQHTRAEGDSVGRRRTQTLIVKHQRRGQGIAHPALPIRRGYGKTRRSRRHSSLTGRGLRSPKVPHLRRLAGSSGFPYRCTSSSSPGDDPAARNQRANRDGRQSAAPPSRPPARCRITKAIAGNCRRRPPG